jgi:hypothetical protein
MKQGPDPKKSEEAECDRDYADNSINAKPGDKKEKNGHGAGDRGSNDMDKDGVGEKKKRRKKSKNTWVYVTGLPSDVTEHEISSHFSKVGLIEMNPIDQLPRIKVYRQPGPGEDGALICKGDCSICYHSEDSVKLALQVASFCSYHIAVLFFLLSLFMLCVHCYPLVHQPFSSAPLPMILSSIYIIVLFLLPLYLSIYLSIYLPLSISLSNSLYLSLYPSIYPYYKVLDEGFLRPNGSQLRVTRAVFDRNGKTAPGEIGSGSADPSGNENDALGGSSSSSSSSSGSSGTATRKKDTWGQGGRVGPSAAQVKVARLAMQHRLSSWEVRLFLCVILLASFCFIILFILSP